MAITNQERVGKALELLRAGLAPYVARELESVFKTRAHQEAIRIAGDERMARQKPSDWDVAALLKIMWEAWNDVFRKTLGAGERSFIQELRGYRNKWAHQEPFSSRDAERAMDSMHRLLTAVSAKEADEVDRMMLELRRLTFDEQVRSEKRKAGGTLIEVASSGAVKPWREVVKPHADVASGRYQQAEFAADLWQVYLDEGSDEYRNPVEFFRRTFLTDSLKALLSGAIERLNGKGGDPVVQLQTNFGGGKTHSMLALFHLFSGASTAELAGIDEVLAKAGVSQVPAAKRVVLVGNRLSPGNPETKKDGTVVRTLWGELAYQLGGKKAFARIAKDDEMATSPGDVLRQLFKEYGPCLILIDEWVAYARQLHDQPDMPGGTFETHFTFAQALTESAKAAGNCLLVVSLPASDSRGSPHTQADDVEVGGIRGREALDRIRNVVGRLEASWRPATAEEGFEIVRRRLFEPMTGEAAFKQRDVTARAFAELYRNQSAEFPPECRNLEYENRIKAAYPIHPEIFDRLYEDWSTLVKFQRTRGVLRLMAAVIHSLWAGGDRTALILPSTVPVDDPRVQNELTRYLSDNWLPIIEKDVDGPSSLPFEIDNQLPALGQLQATRRVARTIYLGSAPLAGSANRGLEDRRVKLGCVMPGESPHTFGDALRHLSARATYLYQDGTRAWYDTQPTVTKLAEERAEQLKRDSDKVTMELESRLRKEIESRGDFARVHLARAASDVPDELEARLVVLPADQPYSREAGSAAEKAAQAILESRGSAPRLYRNTLVFLAADRARMQDLDEALRKYLAWESIASDGALDLNRYQKRQAEQQVKSADAAVDARLPETYQWVLAPEQKSPQSPVSWKALRLTSGGTLADRASKKLRSDDLLVTALGATMLRKQMDEVPLWRENHVSVRQIVEDFARYLYLQRVAGPDVLTESLRSGVALFTWQTDSFAYAESFDESAGRYRGLRAAQVVTVRAEDPGLLVRPEVAQQQLAVEVPGTRVVTPEGGTTTIEGDGTGSTPGDVATGARLLRRFYGTVSLDPARVGRDAARIADEIIAHLAGQVGSQVEVTLEIDARLPGGANDQIVRAVTENSRTLRFKTHAFEEE